eukprot:CAMPEP_0195512034 /NCGR_PEP_ID=MMETSP0794_2-20130614/4146_1 /TAXON_ID=515487 /ORGANISM="Stephanopyxis turris, Strain CCMP 815" /LENGTH=332 /DNA_ID=CAMNT_0040639749 /DNA_START=32 /DNA_END=1030 /DNA_ORIENTATION=-
MPSPNHARDISFPVKPRSTSKTSPWFNFSSEWDHLKHIVQVQHPTMKQDDMNELVKELFKASLGGSVLLHTPQRTVTLYISSSRNSSSNAKPYSMLSTSSLLPSFRTPQFSANGIGYMRRHPQHYLQHRQQHYQREQDLELEHQRMNDLHRFKLSLLHKNLHESYIERDKKMLRHKEVLTIPDDKSNSDITPLEMISRGISRYGCGNDISIFDPKQERFHFERFWSSLNERVCESEVDGVNMKGHMKEKFGEALSLGKIIPPFPMKINLGCMADSTSRSMKEERRRGKKRGMRAVCGLSVSNIKVEDEDSFHKGSQNSFIKYPKGKKPKSLM